MVSSVLVRVRLLALVITVAFRRLDAKCPICEDGDLKSSVVAGIADGKPYTCSQAEMWLNGGQKDMSCAQGQITWKRKCCTLSMKVIEDTCCGQAEKYLSDPAVWKNEPLGVAIGNAQGPCCVIDAGISPSDSIDIFSASKMVTGYTILRLVDKGLLNLDAPVGDYLDWWTKDDSDKRSKVSIKHLLSQVDGLDTFKGGLGQCSASKKTTVECAKVAYESSHRHSPETRFVYTETSFAVLGAVAIKVTDSLDYEAVFRKIVADELDIDASACSWTFGEWVDPGASLKCSMNEYMKLMKAFQNGFVSAELSNEAEKAQTHLYEVPMYSAKVHYGLGQWRECYTNQCLGDEGVWTQSHGALGYYPWKWRKGDAAYWGILARHAHDDFGNPISILLRSMSLAHELNNNIPVDTISASAPAPPPPGLPSPSGTDSSTSAQVPPSDTGDDAANKIDASSTILPSAPTLPFLLMAASLIAFA